MGKIKKMPDLLVNQIAAGEVVERPGSVIKECVENSIDAGATNIMIELEGGGSQLIKIRDNGIGMDHSDLLLSIEKNATSKLIDLEDLNSIQSFGFRGEALPSIASVSRFSLTSRTSSSDVAWCVQQEGEDIASQKCEAVRHDVGTTIVVRDLFFNTPARKRFLKTDQKEYQVIDEVVRKIALAHPAVSFTVIKDGKKWRDIPSEKSSSDQKNRLSELFNSAFADSVTFFEREIGGAKISGWLGRPSFSRGRADHQYWFVNRRPIKDPILSSAAKRAYHDVLYQQRHPVYVLFVEVNPAVVDVNVHPTKEQVRWKDGREIGQWVFRAIHDRLAQPLNAEDASQKKNEKDTQSPIFKRSMNVSRNWSDQFQHRQAQREPIHPSDTQKEDLCGDAVVLHTEAQTIQEHPPKEKQSEGMHELSQQATLDPNVEKSILGTAIAQCNDAFVLAENEQGLIVVDMHAAHERILYEKLKSSYAQNGVVLQRCLLPISVTLPSPELMICEANEALLRQFGFQYNVKNDGVDLTAVPKLLSQANHSELFTDLIAQLAIDELGNPLSDRVNSLLSTIACHGAIRHHRKLSILEMNELLRQIEKTERSGYCNHGRTTWIQITEKELNGWFKRGQ